MNIINVDYNKNQTRIVTDKKLIVAHWAGCSFKTCLSWFKSAHNKRSSAHYIIDINGDVYQLIDNRDISWHAGVSVYKDYPTVLNGVDWFSLNVCSIGVELAGPPSILSLPGWPDAQINAFITLCSSIKVEYPLIKLTDHSTIAAYAKKDTTGKIIDYKRNKDGSIKRGRKPDVLKGKGVNLFPWKQLLINSGVPEA